MRKHKYDIIIYTSCLVAIMILVNALKDYSNTYGLKEDKIEIIETINYEEPQELIELNKEEIIKEYLNNIYNRTITNDQLNYQEIHSWGNYTITNITYIKTITENYYQYEATINSEFIIKDITFFIAKSKDNNYTVKTSKFLYNDNSFV